MSHPVSWFLVAFGVWSWVIWLTFLKNVSDDPRSWLPTGGPTSFFVVHVVLSAASLVLGTVIGVLGVRGLLALRRPAARSADQPDESALADGHQAGTNRH